METEFEEFAGFQWDEGNINKNLVKHQVEDWESEQVFFNEPVLVLDDPKHSLVEKRGNLLRVISARDMNRKEMKYYEENA